MQKRGSLRAAFAALAAAAGTGFASGRAAVGFFAQLGRAAWLGAAIAALAFGLLTGLCAHLARRTGATDFASLCKRSLPTALGRAVGLLHGLLMGAVAAAMLARAARLGELSLPLRRAALWGAGLALVIAVLLNANRRRLPALGLFLALAGALFCGGLALDPRPVRTQFRGEVALLLEGNITAAALMALCWASLNACVAADAVARFTACGARPLRLGAVCGGVAGLLLALQNAAILRGGEALLIQALPVVLLAARWGLVGFWLCAGLGFLCAAATLAAALGSIGGWMSKRPDQRSASAARG